MPNRSQVADDKLLSGISYQSKTIPHKNYILHLYLLQIKVARIKEGETCSDHLQVSDRFSI